MWRAGEERGCFQGSGAARWTRAIHPSIRPAIDCIPTLHECGWRDCPIVAAFIRVWGWLTSGWMDGWMGGSRPSFCCMSVQAIGRPVGAYPGRACSIRYLSLSVRLLHLHSMYVNFVFLTGCRTDGGGGLVRTNALTHTNIGE